MALTGKELDDSIFGTDSHLDWADEVNMEPLHDDPFLHGKQDEGVGSMETSPKNNNGQEPRHKETRSRGTERQQDSRGQRSSMDSGFGGNRRSGSRGGQRNRGGRSTSRHGSGGQQGGRRGMRDRSASIERSGSVERTRNWRGQTGRARADKVDRWDHDKFDGPAADHTARRGSSNYGHSPAAIDIGKIGKEGVSHVTINRRGSNASSRGNLAGSYEQSRRLGGTMDNELAGHARRKSQSSNAHTGEMDKPLSPRASAAASGGTVPYRAPHRRQSSADIHPPTSEPHKPARNEADDEGSSAEMEWENFVANGGLDIPFENITDELLKQPQRPLSSHQRSKGSNRQIPAKNNGTSASDDYNTRNQQRAKKQPEQGISIRGSAKRATAAAPTTSGLQTEMAALSIGQTASRADQVASSSTKQRQQSQTRAADTKPKSTRTESTNGYKANAPSQPSRPHPASTSSRPTTPSKPAAPTRSRSSSTESSPRLSPSGNVPSSYLRRQYEVYDEDRGRHIFSVNIAYDDGRYAPIHIHERDDLAKAAAKFARIWRVHNKELRIKRMLVKMKAVMQDES
ncbi:hypothetical protein IWW36_002301 [Coemansia brasiliensis]|uniref:Uncharacterized protein n=1 Tax=Coemansia brasiliensis TaxID=2650707 RepID=A0A9W8M161_9FUNG|nr:hypothetical protein IWW36_002301 [Coemansia brasiliensis]